MYYTDEKKGSLKGPIECKIDVAKVFKTRICLQPANELPRNRTKKGRPLLNLLVPLWKVCSKTHRKSAFCDVKRGTDISRKLLTALPLPPMVVTRHL